MSIFGECIVVFYNGKCIDVLSNGSYEIIDLVINKCSNVLFNVDLFS